MLDEQIKEVDDDVVMANPFGDSDCDYLDIDLDE